MEAVGCVSFQAHESFVIVLQVNNVVRGAALMFQNLHTVVLRRATHLRNEALAALAEANGPHLKVPRPSLTLPCYSRSLLR